MKSTTELAVMQAIREFRKQDAKASKSLRKMAEEAEESGDYSDYDEANYDYWEAGNEAGLALAHEIEVLIK